MDKNKGGKLYQKELLAQLRAEEVRKANYWRGFKACALVCGGLVAFLLVLLNLLINVCVK